MLHKSQQNQNADINSPNCCQDSAENKSAQLTQSGVMVSKVAQLVPENCRCRHGENKALLATDLADLKVSKHSLILDIIAGHE